MKPRDLDQFDDVTLADLAIQPSLLATYVRTMPALSDEPAEDWRDVLLQRYRDRA